MRDTNQAMLIGKVCCDVESHSDTALSFKLTTTERWKDKTSGDDKSRFEHHRVVCFGELARTTKSQIKKGNRTLVVGAIRNNFWKDKEGIERKSTEIIANTVELMAAVDQVQSRGGKQSEHVNY